MQRIKIDRSKCISCLTCVTACMVSHDCHDSRNRVTVDDKGVNSPIFCRHCDLPECVYTCMSGAMRKADNGHVVYDQTRCASCYMCIMACPYGVLKADRLTQEVIMKCDMCTSTAEKTPQCVAKCPMSAITLQEVN